MTSYNGQLLEAKLASLEAQMLIPKAVNDYIHAELNEQLFKLYDVAGGCTQCADCGQEAEKLQILLTALEYSAERIESNYLVIGQQIEEIRARLEDRQ